jgi:formylglycine-generating enzyme required for sulfatase activity
MKGRALPDGTLSSRLQGPYQERVMASTGPCPEVEEYQQLLRGQLSAQEVEQLAQHIEGCSHCAGLVAALQHQGTLHEVARAARAAADAPGNGSMDALIERLCRQLRPASGTDTPQTIEAPSDLSLEAGALAGAARDPDEALADEGAEARAPRKAQHRPRIALPCSFSLGLTAAVLLAAVGFVGYLVVPAILQRVPGNRSSIPQNSDHDGQSVLPVDVSSHLHPVSLPPGNAATSQKEPAPPAPPREPPPAPPALRPEELASKAQEILRANCYRCHGQDGTIEGGFNYVLDRRQLVARRKIVPGDPEASRLYRRLTSSDSPMPPEGEQPRPTATDIPLISDWIKAGAADFQPESPARQFVSEADILELIGRDLRRLDERSRRFTRYFTITHLHNAGLGADELQTYRHGLARLVNSLSWERRLAVPEAIDPERTVFRFDLRDYKWSEKEWDQVLADYPYGLVMDTEAAQEVSRMTRCRVPHVRADWFVFAASRPPLYHGLLQLPRTERDLEKLLRVDVSDDLRLERVARAGFNGSGVAHNNRVIERHDAPSGAYWRTYDFAGNLGRKHIFAHPLGPGPGKDTFQPDGGEILFNLPNGLQGYLLVDAAGQRLDQAPPNLVTNRKNPKEPVVNGISCMTCHTRGVIDKADQVREQAENNAGAFTRAERESILALYPPHARFAALLQEDADRFAAAVKKTGAPLTGTDPVVELASRYDWELDLSLAAAEAGVRPERFLEALKQSRQLSRTFGTLSGKDGTVQREVQVAAFDDLVHELGLGTVYRQQITNSIGMRLRAIPAGTFTIGSPGDEAGRGKDEVQHNVEITQGFYMGVFEVTQEEYQKVMGRNPSYFQPGGGGNGLVLGRNTSRLPVEGVSWEDARDFCKKLSDLDEEKRSGRKYQLPTEAQWEYACRGRSNPSSPFQFGQTLSSAQANFDGNHPYGAQTARGPSLERTTAVGLYEPNDFGLYDMHGNVAEWCADWYDDAYYKQSPPRDPPGPESGTLHVLRGGSWFDDGKDCRAAARGKSAPTFANKSNGFRVVCVVAEKTP